MYLFFESWSCLHAYSWSTAWLVLVIDARQACIRTDVRSRQLDMCFVLLRIELNQPTPSLSSLFDRTCLSNITHTQTPRPIEGKKQSTLQLYSNTGRAIILSLYTMTTHIVCLSVCSRAGYRGWVSGESGLASAGCQNVHSGSQLVVVYTCIRSTGRVCVMTEQDFCTLLLFVQYNSSYERPTSSDTKRLYVYNQFTSKVNSRCLEADYCSGRWLFRVSLAHPSVDIWMMVYPNCLCV